jgi:ATP-binding cassette subfamily A (ABC1) protein 3
MLGTFKALMYRNFWMTYKTNLVTLLLGALVLLYFAHIRTPLSLVYSILFILMHLFQQSINIYSLSDDRASNFKITYHIMGLKKNQYIFAQFCSFFIQGILMNSLMLATGMIFNLVMGKSILQPFDLKIFIVSLVYLAVLSLYSTTLSYFIRNPTFAKEISFVFNLFMVFISMYLVRKDSLLPIQLISPHTYILKFIMTYFLDKNILDYTLNLYIMLGQVAFYLMTALYLENIWGGDDDHNKHPLFFLNFLKRKNKNTDLETSEGVAENLLGPSEFDENGLTIVNLSKKFDDFTALDNISISFSKGKMHCLLGHNGAGKSTFINILTGLYKPTSGQLIYKNQNLSSLHKSESDKIHIGICPPNDFLCPSMTVYQHLKKMCLIREIKDVELKINKTLEDVNISLYKNYRIDQLSGGYRRKVTIAMSLIGDPDLLFLDEPTSALDPVSRKDIWIILAEIKKTNPDMITILTTHHLEEAETLADNIIVLSGGKIRVKGTIADIKKAFGIGYVLEIISNEPVNNSIFESLINKINSSFGSQLIEKNDFVVSERKVEIKIGLQKIKNIKTVLTEIGKSIPHGMFMTINSNTLESAYIEIDKDIHKNNKLNDPSHLISVLQKLYLDKKTSALRKVVILMNNKLKFLTSDFFEMFKIIFSYLVYISFIALVTYALHYHNQKFDLQYMVGIFQMIMILEVFLSTFSICNLVYDVAKDLKFSLYTKKITPLIYYSGKLAADIVLTTVGYGILFTLFFFVLKDDLLDIENGFEYFNLLAFTMYIWKLSFCCSGIFYHRIFSTTKQVTMLYGFFYYGIVIILHILAHFVGKGFLYLNETTVQFFVYSKEGIGYLEIFLNFTILIIFYLLVSLFFEYRKIAINYKNDNTLSVPMPSEIEENINNGSLNEIQSNLNKTINREVRETLSSQTKKVKVVALRKQYNSSNFALDDVTFSIDNGTQFGLIGPNGAGKSTLFNIILGKIIKTQGNLNVDNVAEAKGFFNYFFDQNPYSSNQYGVCFQGDSTWEDLRVIDNLRFFIDLHQINEEALMELLEYFEFKHYLRKYAKDLSSGNKRKLCIIVSLLINPNMILFDEATCGVDIYMRMRLKSIFSYYLKYNKSMSIFTTHFLKDIELFCDKIGIIDKGRFLCIDYIESVKKSLGGYVSHLQFNDFDSKAAIVSYISRYAEVTIVKEDSQTKIIKCLFHKILNLFDLFAYLLEQEQNQVLSEFSINQLSIEDIYLEVFNRSE